MTRVLTVGDHRVSRARTARLPSAMKAFIPGIYPRSEALVQATRDLDRGRTTQEEVDERVDRDLSELVAVQREAGLEPLADGMLRWQDLFRPLVEASDGMEPGALTRFLDTNTFYRAPNATAPEPRLAEPLGEHWIPPLPGPRLVTLPSPWALAHGAGLQPRTVAEGVLRPQIEALGAEVALVVLVEPFLARAAEPDLESLAEAIDVLAGGPPLALHLVFSDARRLLETGMADLPLDAVGVDFHLTPATSLPARFDKLLLAGVVDARSSALEDPREIADFVAGLDVEEVALVPNGDLQFVAEPIAREKVARLGQARFALAREAA